MNDPKLNRHLYRHVLETIPSKNREATTRYKRKGANQKEMPVVTTVS